MADDLCYRCATNALNITEADPTYCQACLDEISHTNELIRHSLARQAGDDVQRMPYDVPLYPLGVDLDDLRMARNLGSY